MVKIGRAGGKTSNRETPDQIGRVGISVSPYILHEIFPNTTITKGSHCFFDQLGKVKKEDEGKKAEVNQL